MRGVHWRTPLLSSSLPLQQCPTPLVRLIGCFLRREVSGYSVAILWDVASRNYSKLELIFLYSCYLVFLPCILLASDIKIHTHTHTHTYIHTHIYIYIYIQGVWAKHRLIFKMFFSVRLVQYKKYAINLNFHD